MTGDNPIPTDAIAMLIPVETLSPHPLNEQIYEEESVDPRLWRAGWSVICPHKNTSGYQSARDLTHDRWMLGDFEILRKCDAVLMLPGWSQSRGAILEHRYAGDLGLPTFYLPQQAADWLNREQPMGHDIRSACDLIRTQHFIAHQDPTEGMFP